MKITNRYNPQKYDPLYKKLQDLESNDEINLNIENTTTDAGSPS